MMEKVIADVPVENSSNGNEPRIVPLNTISNIQGVFLALPENPCEVSLSFDGKGGVQISKTVATENYATALSKLHINQKVEVLYNGKWYKGAIIQGISPNLPETSQPSDIIVMAYTLVENGNMNFYGGRGIKVPLIGDSLERIEPKKILIQFRFPKT